MRIFLVRLRLFCSCVDTCLLIVCLVSFFSVVLRQEIGYEERLVITYFVDPV